MSNVIWEVTTHSRTGAYQTDGETVVSHQTSLRVVGLLAVSAPQLGYLAGRIHQELEGDHEHVVGNCTRTVDPAWSKKIALRGCRGVRRCRGRTRGSIAFGGCRTG